MNKKYLSIFIIVSGILISGSIVGLANAETTTQSDVQYPIPELGNCESKSSCKVFCDDSKNLEACLTFAEQHNLMSQKELTNAKKFQDNGNVGPGKCRGKDECEQYCGNSDHMEECISFAKENGMMSDQQLQESEKVLAAIKNGIKPPACSGPKQCNAYCSNPKHMEECMTFSIAAGIMPEGQKVQMQKTLEAIKQGAKPPACQPTPPPNQSELTLPGQTDEPALSGQELESCDTYCNTHAEECMSFSLAAGMVPDEEREQMQKSLTAIKQGIKPPACRPKPPMNKGQSDQPGQSGQQINSNQPKKLDQPANLNNKPDQFGKGLQDCDQYCADSSHVEECVNFSVAMGNMTAEQAQSAIKNGNKGPGGCVGKDECDAFCSKPENEETCYNFASENGMIPKEDAQRMQEGQQKMKDNFSSIPPEVLDCITSSLGADVVEKMKTGSVIGRQAGDSINQCFQKFGVQERRQDKNQNDQGQQDQSNQQMQPWVDMCKPDENGNPTALACADGGGNFVISAKVGEDGKPVCPEGSTAKCGNYEQNNRQGQNQRGQFKQNQNQNNQGQQGENFKPGPGNVNRGGQQMPQQAGPGGCKGPEECQKYCSSNPEVCKNFQPQLNKGDANQNDPRQPIQQQGQKNQGIFSPGLKEGDCGTGPGTCSGIGPDDKNPGQFNQPGAMQPQQQQLFQFDKGGQQGPPQPGQPNQFNPLNQPNQLNQINQPGGQQPNQFDQGQPAPIQQQEQQQFQIQQQFQPQPQAPSQP